MMRIAPRLLPEQGCFFRERTSVDSWTLGPKPLCHRHPTGPHPSGLLWTPGIALPSEAEIEEVGDGLELVGRERAPQVEDGDPLAVVALGPRRVDVLVLG